MLEGGRRSDQRLEPVLDEARLGGHGCTMLANTGRPRHTAEVAKHGAANRNGSGECGRREPIVSSEPGYMQGVERERDKQIVQNVRMYTYACVHMQTYMYMYICRHIYAYMYIYICLHTWSHISPAPTSQA